VLYVNARCHHSYRKNDSPHSVECDIVMIDSCSSQQGGMRGIAPPCQNVEDASPAAVDALASRHSVASLLGLELDCK